MILSPSMLFSQIDSMLVLPTKPVDAVKLSIEGFNIKKVEDWGYEILSVFVGDPREIDEPRAIQGTSTFVGDYLEFTPSFPFERGLKYVVKTRPVNNVTDYSFQSFVIEEKQTPEQAKVLSIYPSAGELPENLLRFYIYFNTPMKKGQSLSHIQLSDSEGVIDSRAFMEFKYELWSSDWKRLTILFDPGRIKRGVSTNLELGPALIEGKSYEFLISGSWQDVYGNELINNFTKRFVVEKAYREKINISDWDVQEPSANSYDTLFVHCHRVMDHALIQSMIQIEVEEKNLITGHWEILEQEETIQFIPENKWQKGNYQIVFDSRLEDVAGNNLHSLLDEKVTPKNKYEKAFHFKFNL